MNESHVADVSPRSAAMGILPAEASVAAGASAVSWGAIVAGALAAAALTLILLILGTGLGLSSVSPYSGRGVGAATFGVSTILWLTFTQLAASGMGGYLAGRLRTRWAATHTDEVYFRDTAHGFLSWALASIVTAALLGSVISAIVSGGAQAGATVAGASGTAATAMATRGGSAMRGDGSEGAGYFIDSLFRKDPGAAAAGATAPPPLSSSDDAMATRTSAEVGRIFANGVQAGGLSAEDTKYVGQIVAQRSGLSPADAEKRTADTFARMQGKVKEAESNAREKAEQARKTSAYAALWLFVSLLIGAFVASLAATYGGRRRDL